MFILTEVVLQKAISDGIKSAVQNPNIIDNIFMQYRSPQLQKYYGDKYVESIKEWLSETKIPVMQAWSFDAQRMPCVSIHLGSETDDESKAAIGDHFGSDQDGDIIVNSMSVNLDIGIHADKSKDHVLWLYYIVNHVLYKEKPMLRELGLQLITFNASDYNKESKYMAENIWTRWIRFRCTVQNFIGGEEPIEVESVQAEITADNAQNTNPIIL